jgi:serine/threonine protein phosphatase PrpC
MMAPVLRFEQGVRTHVGAVRTVNEDAHIARPLDGLWAVADGMGGHIKGQWASSTIAAALESATLSEPIEDAVAGLVEALQGANREILSAARDAGGAIGSTVAALLIRDMRYTVLWAGDSRVYRCRDRTLGLLTTDHSQVEQMVASGMLSRAEAENHPMAHVLSRAVGVREQLILDRIDGDVAAGDIFLLCSDGLSRLIGAAEIERLLVDEPPRAVVSKLVDLALDRGAPDNVTVAVVGCDATTLIGVG